MSSLFLLAVALFFWWRNSLAWVILYLSGALFFTLFGIYEDFYFAGSLIGDQHFFATNAVELCSGVVNAASGGLRYSLYIYFIANSTFSCDYNSIAFFGKLSFALLWSILISAVAHYSFKSREVSFWNHFSVFALVVLGWFFSAFLLRDGLVALSLSLIFIPFLVGAGLSKKFFLVTVGIVALFFLRPQFLPALLLGITVALILHLFKNRMQPIKAFSILFLSSLLMLLILPVPAFIGDLMAAYLIPHGTTATANSRFSAEQIREIFSGGGIEASRYLFSQIASRFPSVFYEPRARF